MDILIRILPITKFLLDENVILQLHVYGQELHSGHFPVPVEFRRIFVSSSVTNYFSRYNHFLTGETSQASRCSIAISM